MINRSFYTQRRRFKQLTVPVLAVALVMGLTAAVLVPQAKRVWQGQQQAWQLRQKLALVTDKVDKLNNLDPAELKLRNDKLTASLPSDEDVGYFLSAIRSMADRAEMQFLGVELVDQASEVIEAPGTPDTPKRRTAVRQVVENEIRFIARLKGETAAWQRFVKETEQSAPVTLISDFAFRREVGGGISGKVTLRYFYAPVPESIGGRDQPLPIVTAAEEQVYEQLSEFVQPETVELPRVATGNQQLME